MNDAIAKTWDELATCFFTDYCFVSGEHMRPDGCLTQAGIQDCVHLLMQSNTFESKEEMRREAFADYRIILPEWAFDQWEKRQR